MYKCTKHNKRFTNLALPIGKSIIVHKPRCGVVHFYTEKNGFLYTIGGIQCTPTLFVPYIFIGNKQCKPTEYLLCNYTEQTV